jgi:cytochrome oxidase assembly protein ShyY1
MLAMLGVVVLVVVVFTQLGRWQLDRAISRGEARAEAEAAEVASAVPVPLGDVLAPQTSFPGAAAGRHVVVEGEWGDDVLLVAGRVHDGEQGFLVLAPLRVAVGAGGAGGADIAGGAAADGAAAGADAGAADAGADADADADAGAGAADAGAGGAAADAGSGAVAGAGGATTAVLPVVRGWIASPEDLGRVAPVAGPGRVVGWLRVGEAAGDAHRDLPEGQTDAVSPAELVNRWGGPTYTAYLVVDETTPATSGLIALGPPGRDAGGVDWRNLGYALQWWLFGLFGIALWWRMLGDEVRDRTEAALVDRAGAAAEPAGGPTSASV